MINETEAVIYQSKNEGIGTVSFDKDQQELSIVLADSGLEYKGALLEIIDRIKTKGGFDVEVDPENLKLKNVPPIFLQALREEVFQSLGFMILKKAELNG